MELFWIELKTAEHLHSISRGVIWITAALEGELMQEGGPSQGLSRLSTEDRGCGG